MRPPTIRSSRASGEHERERHVKTQALKRLGFFASYKDAAADIRDYVVAYGGAGRFLKSPYLHLAVVSAALCSGEWLTPVWSDLPLSVVPGLLGFALAAYALLFAFGDENFRNFMAVPTASSDEPKVKTSKLLGVSATFLHFIVVQIAALGLAVIGKSHVLGKLESTAYELGYRGAFSAWPWLVVRDVFAFLSFTAFTLSLTTSLAAAFAIFHMTRWYVAYRTKLAEPTDLPSPPV